MNEPKRVSAPIRMSPELLAKVNEACRRTGKSQATILRLALGMGLEDLKRIDYDIEGTLSKAANALPSHLSMVPDEQGNESSLSTPAPGAQPVKYPTGRRKRNA